LNYFPFVESLLLGGDKKLCCYEKVMFQTMQGFIEKYYLQVWRFLNEPHACPFIVQKH